MKDEAWLFGGYIRRDGMLDDFFELDILSRTWTEIQTGQTKPQRCHLPCFIDISERQLLLHGGYNDKCTFRGTWTIL